MAANNGNVKRLEEKGYEHCLPEGHDKAYDEKLGTCAKYWPYYSDLKIIVIGSSEKEGFLSSGAFVGETEYGHGLPVSVTNLVNILETAFGQIKIEEDHYHSSHAKQGHGILFMNVCLDDDHEDPKSYNTAKLTIKFINNILKEAKIHNKKIAILDMRLRKHTYYPEFKNYVKKFTPDKDINDLPKLCQKDEGFKFENPDNYHTYHRFGHPGYYHIDDTDEESDKNKAVKIFESLKTEYPGIACIYRPECKVFSINGYINERKVKVTVFKDGILNFEKCNGENTVPYPSVTWKLENTNANDNTRDNIYDFSLNNRFESENYINMSVIMENQSETGTD